MSDRTTWRLEAQNEQLRDDVARLRLTDEERAAIKTGIAWSPIYEHPAAVTLRALLERLK
jgi:hypothetical protein